MNVPNIDIGAGSFTAVPRADANGEATPSGPQARPSAAPTSGVSTETSAGSIALTRLAWFDANGDGRIDPRAAGAGGDATLLVPAHQVDLPTYGRVAHPAAGSRSAAARPAGAAANESRNPAQTQRAVTAYQRYGQAPPPPDSVAAAPTATADAISAAPAALHAVA